MASKVPSRLLHAYSKVVNCGVRLVYACTVTYTHIQESVYVLYTCPTALTLTHSLSLSLSRAQENWWTLNGEQWSWIRRTVVTVLYAYEEKALPFILVPVTRSGGLLHICT